MLLNKVIWLSLALKKVRESVSPLQKKVYFGMRIRNKEQEFGQKILGSKNLSVGIPRCTGIQIAHLFSPVLVPADPEPARPCLPAADLEAHGSQTKPPSEKSPFVWCQLLTQWAADKSKATQWTEGD